MINDNEYHVNPNASPSNLCFRTLILKVSSKKHLFFCSFSFEAVPQKQGQRIDRFVSFTHPFDIKSNRRFLYYFSVYVNLFKELFLNRFK